ncbi:MAG: hypothetical protein ABSE73_27315, partial [Planctomycetota bacterium]
AAVLRLGADVSAAIVSAARRRPGTHNSRRVFVEQMVTRRLADEYLRTLSLHSDSGRTPSFVSTQPAVKAPVEPIEHGRAGREPSRASEATVRNLGSAGPRDTGSAPAGIGERLRVFYALTTRPVLIRGLAPEAKYRLTCFDPVTGERTQPIEIQTDADGSFCCPAPTHTHDWAAVLERNVPEATPKPALP